jgi:hypothetical protein
VQVVCAQSILGYLRWHGGQRRGTGYSSCCARGLSYFGIVYRHDCRPALYHCQGQLRGGTFMDLNEMLGLTGCLKYQYFPFPPVIDEGEC